MSDWDFLHEMHDRGYSSEEIADAAGAGAAPWEWASVGIEWEDTQLDEAPEEVPASRQSGESFRSRDGFPYSVLEQTDILEELVDCAKRHFNNTGRYLQVWGELGEIYAEIKFGLCRHGSRRAGSDGTITGKLVEVKTISPEKATDRVLVKRQGNFEQLLVVRIDHEFHFQGKLFERSELKGSSGKYLHGQFMNDPGNA